MNTHTGKIARLPKNIREQLNARLENGERAPAILKWLNELPEIQKIITEQFAGHPIRPQNLSQWRHGGYLDWTRHQLLRQQTRSTSEQATDLNTDTAPDSISISEDIALILSAELALHVQALSAMKNPKTRFRQFRYLTRELSRLRRDDQRALRTKLRREQFESSLEPVEENSGTGVPPVRSNSEPPSPELSPTPASRSPVGDDVRSLKLPDIQAAPLPEPSSPATPNHCEDRRPASLPDPPRTPDASTERASIPDCGSPLSLTDAVGNPNPPAIPEHPPYNPPLPHSTLNYQPSTIPLPPNPTKSHHKIFSVPTRGRRFTCIEG